MDVARLNTEAGRQLIDRAAELLAIEPNRAAVALRRYTQDAAMASEALNQAHLRQAAMSKFGPDAASLFFTREGLEQASRRVVADRRAARLAAAGVETAADLCCGIGSDAIAMARHGIQVLAIDNDVDTAQLASVNAAALGMTDRLDVCCADVRQIDVAGRDGMFADPARRANGRRIYDPSRYLPPLQQLWDVSANVPQRVCKIGPGIDHSVIPTDAEAEWVSVDGSVVEAALWRGSVASAARRASVLRGVRVTELTGSGDRAAPVGDVDEFLFEPDNAVIRAHLVAELAQLLGARLAHPDIAYLYGSTAVCTPLATVYRVSDVLPFHVKKLRELFRSRNIGRLTIKKRGADVVPDRLRRDLKLSGDDEATLIITRVADRHTAIVCQAVTPQELAGASLDQCFTGSVPCKV